LPEGDELDRTFRIHEDDDGTMALYVCTGVPGQTTLPNDHGGVWAIVVGVRGSELHRIYRRTDGSSQPGVGQVEVVGEIEVSPGNGITLGTDGIHSIHTISDETLWHLHCYGLSFEKQTTRKEYEMETGTYKAYTIGDYGSIEEGR
jgi:predicted metal-dependent enzyme (double-stranded beta helix superfamily)